MHPLRQSTSLPSLSSTSATDPRSLLSLSPIPPSRATHDGGSWANAGVVALTSSIAAASDLHASRVLPPSSLTRPPPASAQYAFPTQPYTPPPLFGRLLPTLFRCCTFGSVSHSYLATLRLRCCLYVSPEPLPPSTLLFFQQQCIHVQLLCSLPPPPSALPAPTASCPFPLSVASCAPAGHSSPLPAQLSLSALLKPALEYALSSSSQPLLLLSASPLQPLLPQLTAALRSLQGWPLSSVVEEWSRLAPAIGMQALSEAECWPAEDELWLAEEDKAEWWRNEERRKRRTGDRLRRNEEVDREEGEEDVESELERLFGAAFQQQRLVTQRAVFDEHASIVEDNDD